MESTCHQEPPRALTCHYKFYEIFHRHHAPPKFSEIFCRVVVSFVFELTYLHYTRPHWIISIFELTILWCTLLHYITTFLTKPISLIIHSAIPNPNPYTQAYISYHTLDHIRFHYLARLTEPPTLGHTRLFSKKNWSYLLPLAQTPKILPNTNIKA